MAITQKEVEQVARLARLALSDEEKNRYTAQLDSILGYIEKLKQLNTENIQPTTHALPMANVWREDRMEPSTAQTTGSPEELVGNAPEREGPFFKVKKVIE